MRGAATKRALAGRDSLTKFDRNTARLSRRT